MRYSLTDYILSVKIPDELLEAFSSSSDTSDESSKRISIGGDGSYVGSIKVTMSKEQWSTEGDVTGSWIQNKNKDKTGKVTVEINQLSDIVLKLTRLVETYYAADTVSEGLTLTITKATGSGNSLEVCNCVDCYLTKQSDGSWADTAKSMNWEFTCGQINYSGNAM